MTAPLDPWIQTQDLRLDPPSLRDNTADADRLVKALRKQVGPQEISLPLACMGDLPHLLRSRDFHLRVAGYADRGLFRVIDLLPTETRGGLLGLACDLGSTTLVLRLVDLSSGDIRDTVTFFNPQIAVGQDILTRIHHAAREEGLRGLQDLVIQALNREIRALAGRHGIAPESLFGLSIAGNTTMTHLFLGLTPYWICREPYIPVVNSLGLLTAADLGLGIHPRAPVLVFPSVGSYFGGDLIAGILASGMYTAEETSFLVDVGTNAEVVVGNADWLMACAGAAGPALEGGVAGMGMLAGPGVIDQVRIDPRSRAFTLRTIEGNPPVGICGSGLIDLVAQMSLAGMLDLRGKLLPAACGERFLLEEGIPSLLVVPEGASGTGRPLTLAQTDIDGLIRSKAAMYTILTTIGNTVGIPLNEIPRFYVAGTFGSYIDPRSAITIGMIPDLPLQRYRALGNTSLEGATLALLSARLRDEVHRIRDRITYLELNVNQEFMNLFSAAKFLPHTDRSLFPSVLAPAEPPEGSP